MNHHQHEQELKRMAMRIALDLGVLNRHDGLLVVEMAHVLISRFLHPVVGDNLAIMDLEKSLASCGR